MKNHIVTIPTAQSQTETVTCISGLHIEIQCMPDSRYDLLVDHRAGSINCVIHLERGSFVTVVFVGKQTVDGQVQCSINAQGAGSQAAIIGVYDIQELGALSLTTEQHHTAAHTTSSVHMRKVVRDQAYSQYNGMIHIAKEAVHADASQKDLTLLIGMRARAESVPSIEVKTNDVKCMHGSAIGRLDEHQINYMHARGLDTSQAHTLLLHGFFVAALDTINHDGIRAHAQAVLGIDNETLSR